MLSSVIMDIIRRVLWKFWKEKLTPLSTKNQNSPSFQILVLSVKITAQASKGPRAFQAYSEQEQI
jgi:hypothetical protein